MTGVDQVLHGKSTVDGAIAIFGGWLSYRSRPTLAKLAPAVANVRAVPGKRSTAARHNTSHGWILKGSSGTAARKWSYLPQFRAFRATSGHSKSEQ